MRRCRANCAALNKPAIHSSPWQTNASGVEAPSGLPQTPRRHETRQRRGRQCEHPCEAVSARPRQALAIRTLEMAQRGSEYGFGVQRGRFYWHRAF
jgi:hypothetical protein